jgi:diguanylate cyclase (GGDEF)-like protein
MIDPQRIWKNPSLPTLPIVAVRLLDVMRDPSIGVRDVVEVVRTDPAISAKIIKAANSTLFSLSTKVASLDRAAGLLGTTVVSSLALSFSLVDAAMPKGVFSRHYSACWLQSLVQAAAAEAFGRCLQSACSSEFFLAGLLTDVGRLAMLKTIPEPYAVVLDAAASDDRPLSAVEKEHLGFDHAEIGSQLARNWNLPESIVNATLLQDSGANDLISEVGSPGSAVVLGVALASAAGDYFCTHRKGTALHRMRTLCGRIPGLPAGPALDAFLADLKPRIDETCEMFNVSVESIPGPADLLAEAGEQLAQLAMREHVASTKAEAKIAATEEERRLLQHRNEELRVQAERDSLTGMFNRKVFDAALEQFIEAACRDATPLGTLFIDVDHFKKVNDTFGHAAGDYVLQKVAHSLSRNLRTEDLLARYGGEEFVVLLPNLTEKGLQRVAERLRTEVEATRIQFEGKAIPITVSVGAAMILPGRDGADAGKELLAAADAAMYDSKKAGRNRMTFRSLISPQDRELLTAVLAKRFSRWLVADGRLTVAQASKVLAENSGCKVRLGDLAVQLGVLTEHQTRRIGEAQEENNALRFGEAGLQLGFFDREQLCELLAWHAEPPRDLAALIIKNGLLDAPTTVQLLQRYLSQLSCSRSLAPSSH